MEVLALPDVERHELKREQGDQCIVSDQPHFECCMCKGMLNLEESFPLAQCTCLACRDCVATAIKAQLRETLAYMKGLSSRPVAANADGAVVLGDRGAPTVPVQSLPCPACRVEASLDRADIVDLSVAELRELEGFVAEFSMRDVPQCPACGAGVEMRVVANDADLPEGLRPTGIPEFDRTVPRHLMQNDAQGKPISREALVHRERHRFRCLCGVNFCGLCREQPYHLGFTCASWAAHALRPRCFWCGDLATSSDALTASSLDASPTGCGQAPGAGLSEQGQSLDARISKLPLRFLRQHLDAMGLSAVRACVERHEVEVLAKSVHVCDGIACRSRLDSICFRVLPCGHVCSGCKGEPECPRCITCEGSGGSRRLGMQDIDEDAHCPTCAELLRPGPCVELPCGHVMHAECLAKQLGVDMTGSAKWRPPRGALSFDFRKCPGCRATIEDLLWPPEIGSALRKATVLQKDVAERAMKRLKLDPHHRRDDAILPGGAFDGRPKDYAMSIYRYQLCDSCNQPYFGGERRCDEAAGAIAAGNREGPGKGEQQLCGGCAAAKSGAGCRRGHDPSFVEWKCYYCCAVASWFCWGTTHMCHDCHENPGHRRCGKTCSGGPGCPLATPHPPNGTGKPFCLGCSLCRYSDPAA